MPVLTGDLQITDHIQYAGCWRMLIEYFTQTHTAPFREHSVDGRSETCQIKLLHSGEVSERGATFVRVARVFRQINPVKLRRLGPQCAG